MKKAFFIQLFIICFCCSYLSAGEINIKVSKKYLNLPVSHQENRGKMKFFIKGKEERAFDIRLSSNPEYWVFYDLSAWKGKTITVSFEGNDAALEKIYQADEIEGSANLYKEEKRPQLHYSTRRGWNNDPNGLVYYDGEYHLFYQHNPYERDWGNMSWGHAVSKDLIHWEELQVALHPDRLGTMFSGSAVVDYNNTSGFGKGKNPAMVAIYTADGAEKQVQCIAYSLDKGRTWTKYEGNPVIDSKQKWNCRDTRDPKVFWHQPTSKWVMVLNERDGHSIYTSPNLKDWVYESHVTGFWECPELFELPVDGNPEKTKWVMYGASGGYMIGNFDGKKFTPETGKYYYATGSLYAGQMYNEVPDGRKIQIAWGRINQPGMPFNMMMLLPTELTLKTTNNGIRLFSVPIKEADKLQDNGKRWNSLSSDQANEVLKPYKDLDCFRLKTTIKSFMATEAGLMLNGQDLLRYDMIYNLLNGVFYSPDDMTSMEITADIIVDKTSIEVYINNGHYSYSMERRNQEENNSGLHFFGRDYNHIEVSNLEIYNMKSIW